MPEPSNIAPSFAREAARFLHDENYQQALELCLAGTQKFPQYATGYLILGKCYEALNRFVESLAAYRQALNILPDNATLLMCVRHVEEREVKEKTKASEEQKRAIPPESPTITQPIIQDQATEESAIEYLAKRLQDVKRIQPGQHKEAGSSNVQSGDGRSVKFITVTMAEIYVGQGEFAEAIAAYNELIQRHPEDAHGFRARIAEIERLARARQHE